MIVFLAVVVGAFVFTLARAVDRRRRAVAIVRRVEAHVRSEAPRPASPGSAGEDRAHAVLGRLESALDSRPGWAGFVARVERSGVRRRPVELLAATAVATVAAVVLALAAAPGLAVVLALAAPALAVWLGLGVLVRRRLRAFDEQLPDLLTALSASLRAGHGFLQSLQAVAQDAPEPTRAELRRALAEIRVGRSVEDALACVGERVESADFTYVLTAISVQHHVGGSLANLFETVTETVRERHQFARKVKALTATGRTSASVLVALPFATAALLTLVNHDAMVPLFQSHTGRLLIVVGCCSLAVGAVLVRRVVDFKV